jgi:hypothetical protein
MVYIFRTNGSTRNQVDWPTLLLAPDRPHVGIRETNVAALKPIEQGVNVPKLV